MMIKVFMMNDWDWVAAESLEEAIKWYCEECGMPEDEACEDPHGITQARSNELKFYEEFPDKENPISFTERLKKIVARGDKFPCLFASTEF